MTRPILHLPPEPEGFYSTCEGPGKPIEITIWRGHVLHKIRIPAARAVLNSRELLACALQSGITETVNKKVDDE